MSAYLKTVFKDKSSSSPANTNDSQHPNSKLGPDGDYPLSLIQAYNITRREYTSISSVVPAFENSGSNLSQASLNRDMLRFLELEPHHTIADLGSGCGVTANTFALFGCQVSGFEFHKRSTEVAKKYAIRLGCADRVDFRAGAVNDNLGDGQYDRLHGGYMMSDQNATKYAQNNLKPGGIAVLNVGGANYGDVYIFRKGANGRVSKSASGMCVVFQEDAKP